VVARTKKRESEDYAEAARICACFNLRKASRAVTLFFDEVLAPTSLRSTQFVALLAILLNEPISLPALAREMVLERTTLLRNLEPLVRGKLVATSRVSRSRMFRLTDKGRKAVEGAFPYWREAQERFVTRLGGTSWDRLLELLPGAVNAARST